MGIKAFLCLYESEETATSAAAPTTAIPHLPALLRALWGAQHPTAPRVLGWDDCAALLREEEARARVERATAAPRLEVCEGQPSALGPLHVAGAWAMECFGRT